MPNQVNLDDELFEPDEEAKAAAAAAKKKKKGKKAKEEEDKALGAAELEFDEFCEIVARTCNEKVRDAFRPAHEPEPESGPRLPALTLASPQRAPSGYES